MRTVRVPSALLNTLVPGLSCSGRSTLVRASNPFAPGPGVTAGFVSVVRPGGGAGSGATARESGTAPAGLGVDRGPDARDVFVSPGATGAAFAPRCVGAVALAPGGDGDAVAGTGLVSCTTRVVITASAQARRSIEGPRFG
jgi:hypothetical protein